MLCYAIVCCAKLSFNAVSVNCLNKSVWLASKRSGFETVQKLESVIIMGWDNGCIT
jgi:hypothetical protein